MAASVEKWFCEELSKLGIDATEENAQYILSMGDADDLQEYMLNLLDGSDPQVQAFLPRLMDRWCSAGGKAPPAITVYKKEDAAKQMYVQPRTTGRKKRGKNRNGGANPAAQPAPSVAAAAADAGVISRSAGVAATVQQDRQGEEGVKMMMNGGGPPSSTAFSALSSVIINGTAAAPSSSVKPVQPQPMQNGEVTGGGITPLPGQHGGARKKSKFVPLYSQQGKEKLVITLPGRSQCECQALKHELINNCMSCGRVVCKQEGAGPCLFCGSLVCTPEDQEVLNRGSKKSEKLRQHLMRDADKFTPLCRGGGMVEEEEGRRQVLPSVSARVQEGLEKAVKHKERLLEFDRTSVRRTQVIDDECDYFATDSNQWLSQHEREALRKREEELRSARFASRKDRKMTLDFAGRQVVMEDGSETGRTMYDHKDSVVQEVQYGKRRGQGGGAPGQQQGGAKGEEEAGGYLVNPGIVQPAPQFVPSGGKAKSKTPTPPPGASSSQSTKPQSGDSRSKWKGVGVIQDRELREMTDEGMCLSMHQPWASLLVAGIKIHEGRTWYTAHRGRLWIAATAKTPSPEEISEMERHYQFQYQNGDVDFPPDYPSGCLLGCVDLVDCLSQEDYRQQFPDGESACPYVFICENPQQLLIKFPMKGKHKIYKLDSTIHQAAKKGLR